MLLTPALAISPLSPEGGKVISGKNTTSHTQKMFLLFSVGAGAFSAQSRNIDELGGRIQLAKQLRTVDLSRKHAY
jgi:hypothetical protein